MNTAASIDLMAYFATKNLVASYKVAIGLCPGIDITGIFTADEASWPLVAPGPCAITPFPVKVAW